jgi:hypothetical protein
MTNMQKFLIVFTLISIVWAFVFFWLVFFFVLNGSTTNIVLLIMMPLVMPLVGIFIWVGYVKMRVRTNDSEKKYVKMMSILFLSIFILTLSGGASCLISLLFTNSHSWSFYYFAAMGSMLILFSPSSLWVYCICSNKWKKTFWFKCIDWIMDLVKP